MGANLIGTQIKRLEAGIATKNRRSSLRRLWQWRWRRWCRQLNTLRSATTGPGVGNEMHGRRHRLRCVQGCQCRHVLAHVLVEPKPFWDILWDVCALCADHGVRHRRGPHHLAICAKDVAAMDAGVFTLTDYIFLHLHIQH